MASTPDVRRLVRVLLVFVLAGPVVGAVGVLGASPLPDPVPPGRHRVVAQVTALGDSVPAGAACGCTPFPQLYGARLASRTGTTVHVANDAVSGLDTGGLVAQLRQVPVADDVRRADVVLVTIGANDFTGQHDQVLDGRCGGDPTSECVADELEQVRARLADVLARLRALRGDRPTTVLVTGYWNVFEDGQVARDRAGPTGRSAALRLTRRLNDVVAEVARAAGATYVDVFTPFQRSKDIDDLLAPDGDHPSAAGQRLLARTLVAAGLPVSRPR